MASSDRLAAMLTGLRRSELQSIKWSNVDFVTGSVAVESGYAKTGETATIPLHPDLAKVLKICRTIELQPPMPRCSSAAITSRGNLGGLPSTTHANGQS